MSARRSHIARDLVLVATGVTALLVAAAVAQGAGFALAILLILITIGAFAIPALVIWAEERDDRFRHHTGH